MTDDKTPSFTGPAPLPEATRKATEANKSVATVHVVSVYRGGANEISEPILELTDEFERLIDAAPGKVFSLYTAPPADGGLDMVYGNLALANRTARHAMEERDSMICNLRKTYSAIEIADMVGLTRQRIHQILKETDSEKASPVAPPAASTQKGLPACKGMNCGSTDGVSHSLECQAEHAAAIAGDKFAKEVSAQKGLSDEQILDVAERAYMDNRDGDEREFYLRFARAILRESEGK